MFWKCQISNTLVKDHLVKKIIFENKESKPTQKGKCSSTEAPSPFDNQRWWYLEHVRKWQLWIHDASPLMSSRGAKRCIIDVNVSRTTEVMPIDSIASTCISCGVLGVACTVSVTINQYTALFCLAYLIVLLTVLIVRIAWLNPRC